MKKHPVASGAVLSALAALVLLLGSLACRPAAPPPERAPPLPEGAPPLPEGAPRLILFIVLDQGRYDYLVRFRPLLRGGFHRLLEESVVFTDAHHDHARTTTAPGHATLSTGRHPAHHGIIDNYWYERQEDERIYSVRDSDGDRSPRRLLSPAFGDWLKAASPGSKVFAASAKDRAAILTAGHRADAAFWLDRESGEMVTSSYYPWRERPWLEAFHQEHHADRYFGTLWEALPEVTMHAAEYDVEPLDRGPFNPQFPRALGPAQPAPGASFYNAIYSSPFADDYLGNFARALVDGERLGTDDVPDFLGLSFSALDTVGHDYGPHSPEVLDTLLRLDRVLAELLDFVDERIGLDRVLVSLSADHGVAAVPEVLAARGLPARRFGAEEILCVQRAEAALRRRFGDEDWILRGPYLNRDLAEERGVAPEELEEALVESLTACPGVARAWTRTELMSATAADPFTRLFRHGFHPERGPDVALMFEHQNLSMSIETTHGSPHPYDTWVPWLLRLPQGGRVVVEERVHTVDVAPTLAALIGLQAPAELDGVDRSALFRPATAAPPEAAPARP